MKDDFKFCLLLHTIDPKNEIETLAKQLDWDFIDPTLMKNS
jgi:hypothetical protein